MDVNQLFAELSYGELSNLALANDGNGTITDAAKPRLLIHANEALLRLYTRYVLKTSDVLIELVDHITNYHLLAKFAESQWETSPQEHLYIKDLMREPFTEDVIRILTVFDSYSCPIPLNDPDHEESIYTPQGNVLQVPRPVTGMALSIVYQAKHPLLVLAPTPSVIDLPDVLWGAYKAYIGYLVYNNMNTQEANGIAQEHLNRYETICGEVLMQDLVTTSMSSTNVRFQKNGWS